MKEIHTIDGHIVLVDDDDFSYVSLYDLYINKGGYVFCKLKKKYRNMGLFSSMALHKVLMYPYKTGRGIVVDHINGNKLDNRKKNLRVCTHRENMMNRKAHSSYANKETSSIYKGVCWSNTVNKWMVQLSDYENGRRGHIGYFTDEIAAANAYNYYAREKYGEFALLNEVEFMTKEEWVKYKLGTNKLSQYRGVTYDKKSKQWVAQICHNYQKYQFRFGTEIEAALKYNEMALKLKGDKAKLNSIHMEIQK